MIIDKRTYLEHFGVKGMRWGKRRGPVISNVPPATRKESKAVDKAFTAKAQRERAKRHAKNPKNAEGIELATQKLVAEGLANPKSLFEVRGVNGRLIVEGRDFSELVIGRFGNKRLDPWPDKIERFTRSKS